MSTITEDGFTKSFSMPAGSYEPGLRIIHGQSAPTIVERAKSGIAGAWGWLRNHINSAWGWVKYTLHLQAGMAWANEHILRPVRFGVRVAADRIGYSGGAGVSLLLISTGVGHKILHYLVGVPVAFIGKWSGKGYHMVMNFHGDHLGRYGDWMADRMAELEELVWGPNKVSGVVGMVSGFYVKHVAVHLTLDSIVMRTARLVGTGLFGASLIGLLPMFVAGTVLSTGVYLVAFTTIGLVGWQTYSLGFAIGSIPSVARWLNNDDTNSAATQATSRVHGVNITTLVEDMAAETAGTTETTGDLDAAAEPAHNPHVRRANPNRRPSK